MLLPAEQRQDQHAPSVPRGEGKRFQYFTQSKSSPGRVCTVPAPSMHWVDRLPQSPIANIVSISLSDSCAIHVRPPPDHPQTNTGPPRECRKQNEECRMAGQVIYEPCAWEEVATHKPASCDPQARCKPGARGIVACVPLVLRSYSAYIPLILHLYYALNLGGGPEVISWSQSTLHRSRRPARRCTAWRRHGRRCWCCGTGKRRRRAD